MLLFSHPVVSDSLWSHGQQHARPPCPSPPPKVFWIHVHCISDDIQPSHPLMPSSPSALNLSQHQELFSSESAIHIGWPKYWSFSFSISPSNEYWGLISFKKEWLDLLAVQGTLRSLLQQHSSGASILWCSAFTVSSHTLCDHWEDHSLDYVDLCWQSDVCPFQHTV